MRRSIAISMTVLALTAGCATRRAVQAPAVVATLPAPPPAPAVAMPKGAYPGMPVPARLADGRYATPNRDLTPAATVWHLRAALNVAALACRGGDAATIVNDYNALLTSQKAPLAAAQSRYAAEWKASGGDWQKRYDDAMTRLYNFFSQSPARDGFCRAAAATLSDAQTVTAADLPAFASGRLAVLEQPFTDFYAAYDAWRADRARLDQLAMVSMPVPANVVAVQAVPAAAPAARPRLAVDTSALIDTAVAQ
ncbi:MULTISPECIES: hypothetical protein [unclassified Sphingomonas]|uniref:hypothetical protein n=1 Tax=unclassified Sphingomonas TaxID=196159 RepID=UPI000E103AA9|nr:MULTISPECIES: hypothetical protein [unclassified Sphingomonas]AXJ94985.1 hypothetical protein DM480_05170 [Sphingomonas sp. FARSPH]